MFALLTDNSSGGKVLPNVNRSIAQKDYPKLTKPGLDEPKQRLFVTSGDFAPLPRSGVAKVTGAKQRIERLW